MAREALPARDASEASMTADAGLFQTQPTGCFNGVRTTTVGVSEN